VCPDCPVGPDGFKSQPTGPTCSVCSGGAIVGFACLVTLSSSTSALITRWPGATGSAWSPGSAPVVSLAED